MTPQQRRRMREKIIKGGRIADQIRSMSKHHHDELEVPNAEETIDQELRAAYAEKSTKKGIVPKEIPSGETPKLSLWHRILNFLKHLFLP